MVSCFNWFLQNTCAACGGARRLSRSPGTRGLGPVLRGDLSQWTWKHVPSFLLQLAPGEDTTCTHHMADKWRVYACHFVCACLLPVACACVHV